jgi:hypothetical protein
VGRACLGPAAALLDPQQPLDLQRLDGAHRHQARQQLDPQRIAVGEQLEDAQLVLVGALQAGGDQLHQPRRHRPRPLPAPHAVRVGQRALIEPGDHQLPQQQRVAAGRPPQPGRGRRVDLPAQRRAEHLLDLQRRQRQQVEPLDDPILPQRGDRVGCGLPASERDQHERRTGADDLVQQRRRGVVEQVRVVDPEHQAPLVADPHQRLRRGPQQVRARQVGGEQLRERPERDRPGRPRGDRAPAEVAGGISLVERLQCEAGLAHPRLAGHHDAGYRRVAHGLRDQRKLRLTAPEGPRRDRHT